jgi:hypothetical protein
MIRTAGFDALGRPLSPRRVCYFARRLRQGLAIPAFSKPIRKIINAQVEEYTKKSRRALRLRAHDPRPQW